MNTSSILSSAVSSPRLLSTRLFSLPLLLLLIPAFSGGNPLHAQERLQLSFQHEARGAAELQRTDSGLIVRNLGNGPQDRVALILGSAPTDREQRTSFIVSLAEPASSIPVNGAIRYQLLGTEDGSTSEVQSTLRVTRFEPTTVTYAVDFREVEEMRAAVAEHSPSRFNTNRLVFSVRRGSADSIQEQVECGCFDKGVGTPICIWEIGWSVPVRIYLSGIDTTGLYDRIRITAVHPDSFPEYLTSLELSTDSIPTIRIDGEGIHRTEHWNDNVYSAAGRAVTHIDSGDHIVVTGLDNGTWDGLDVWGITGSPDGIVLDLEADLRDPEACIYTTFYGAIDTAGYVGFVRDSIGIRFLATMRHQRSDSSLLDVFWGNSFQAPQNQILGWIPDNVVLLRIGYISPSYPWFYQNYQIDFEQPATLQRESKFSTASFCRIEPPERATLPLGVGNVKIRAGAIDTLRIGKVSGVLTGIEAPPQRERTEPALQLVRRGDALYIRYGGVEPGRGRLRIIDMAGRVVREVTDLQVRQEEGILPLDIVPLPAGAYLLELDVEGDRVAGKSVVTGM